MLYTIFAISVSGTTLAKNLVHLTPKPGVISVFPFSILSTVYFATYSLVNELKLNFTFATLLKLVSTGPGFSVPTLT